MARKSANQKLLDALAELNKNVSDLSDRVDDLNTSSGGTSSKTGGGGTKPYRSSHGPAGSPNDGWRGASFATGDDHRMLSANMRSGLIGEPNFRTALAYGSFFTGRPARKVWDSTVDNLQKDLGRGLTHDELEQVDKGLRGKNMDPGFDHLNVDESSQYKGWRAASETLGHGAMAITAGQNAWHAAERISNLGAGPAGSMDPYLQVQGPGTMGDGTPWGNLGPGSSIWERKEQGIKSMWAGVTNFNWSGDQESRLRNQFLSMGVSPDDSRHHGSLGMIRDLSRLQGIDSGTLTGMSSSIIQRGDSTEMAQFAKTMTVFSKAARDAHINVQAAAQSLQQFAQTYSQQTGVNANTALALGTNLAANQNVQPGALPSLMQSPVFQSLSLSMGSQLDPRHPFLAAQSMHGQNMATDELRKHFLMPMLGISNEKQMGSKDATDRYLMLKRTGTLDQMGMGGMDQSQFVKFMTKDLSKKDQNKLTQQAEKLVGGGSKSGDAKVEIQLSKEAAKRFKLSKSSVLLNFSAKNGLEASVGGVGGSVTYDGLNATL